MTQPEEMTAEGLNGKVGVLCVEISDLKDEVKNLRKEVDAMSVTMNEISAKLLEKK